MTSAFAAFNAKRTAAQIERDAELVEHVIKETLVVLGLDPETLVWTDDEILAKVPLWMYVATQFGKKELAS